MIDESENSAVSGDLSATVKAKATRYETPPALWQSIIAAVEQAAAPPAAGWWLGWPWLKLGAAVACGIFASLLVTQMYFMPSQKALVSEEVVAAHVRSLMVAHLEDIASTDQHTVKPWFNGKLDFSPPVNDFSSQGFPLTGGRLDYIDHHFAAALVYRRRGHVINVFVWPTRSTDQTLALDTRREGFNLIAWNTASMQFWTISDVNSEELRSFAELLRNENARK